MTETTKRPQATSHASTVAELEARLDAVQAQREEDLGRYRRAVQELEWLRQEVALRNAEASGEKSDKHSSDDDTRPIERWEIMPAAARSVRRGEKKLTASPLAWLYAKLFLRLARGAARRRDYATAEVFYQAVLYFRPRAFLWRQLGNMLAGQGLFRGAIQSFNQAIKMEPGDAEAWFVKSVALKRIGEADRSWKAHVKAVRLDPKLADRPRV